MVAFRPRPAFGPRSLLLRLGLLVSLPAAAAGLAGCASSTELSDEERYDIYMTNATRYYEKQRYPESEQQVRKALAIEPASDEAKLVLGWALLYQATNPKVDAAERHFTLCAADDPGDFRYALGLGFARFAAGKMLSDRAAAIEAQPPDLETSRDDLARRSASVRAEAETKLVGACEALEKTLALEPDYPRALACLGQARMLLGRFDGATAAFERYLPSAERTRRFLEEQAVDGPDEMERKLASDKIARNVSSEIEVRIAVANVRYKQGRYAEAIEQLDKVLVLAPKNDEALFNRGQCRYAQKEYDLSRADLRKFLDVTSRPFDEMVRRSYDLLTEIERRAPMAAQSPAPETAAPK